MRDLADIAANPRGMKDGTKADFADMSGAAFTIYRYRKARECAFCQYGRRTVSAFRTINGRGQITGAGMLCAGCLQRVIAARRAGRYLFGITPEQRRGIEQKLTAGGVLAKPTCAETVTRRFTQTPMLSENLRGNLTCGKGISEIETMTAAEVEAANAEDRAAITRRYPDFVINPNLARDFDWLYGHQRYAD